MNMEIYKNYLNAGAQKSALALSQMMLLSVMAGAFIALAGVASTCAGGGLAGACVFPGGLAMVILLGTELFTGNALMVAPLMERRITLWGMLRNWAVVYMGNFAGALAIAYLVYAGGLNIGDAAVKIAVAKGSLPFISAFARGILCNVLVCVAVWVSFHAKDVTGKIVGIFFPVMFFVLCGFEHSVANMYFLSVGAMFSDSVTLSHIAANLVPVTLGNIVGGAAVAMALFARFCDKMDEAVK